MRLFFWRKLKKKVERPVPPCNSEVHYYWTDDGWPCPACAAIAEAQRAAHERDILAEAIAVRLAELNCKNDRQIANLRRKLAKIEQK